MFNQCVDLGFSYFQGYFLARPQLLRGRRAAPARPALAALMSQLADPDIGIGELTASVSADPVLSFSLIRLINSPRYRRARPIESVREAIGALGVERVRGWCYLLVLARIGGKPAELTRIAMRRARFCELLGEMATGAMPGRCFTAGILSTLDAFMDEELDTVVDSMSLSGELRAALLRREGCMGAVLDTALAFETASWEQVPWRMLADARHRPAGRRARLPRQPALGQRNARRARGRRAQLIPASRPRTAASSKGQPISSPSAAGLRSTGMRVP